jgi:hypothetical protein
MHGHDIFDDAQKPSKTIKNPCGFVLASPAVTTMQLIFALSLPPGPQFEKSIDAPLSIGSV